MIKNHQKLIDLEANDTEMVKQMESMVRSCIITETSEELLKIKKILKDVADEPVKNFDQKVEGILYQEEKEIVQKSLSYVSERFNNLIVEIDQELAAREKTKNV